jgi:predicted nucleotidyltransferase
MKTEVRRITTVLNEASVRYVVAGGLAVIAHGYLRLTMDVDLVIDLEHDNLLRALQALEKAGYKPRLPVTMDQFANEETRDRWINEKHMQVFPLWNPSDVNGMAVDVFVKCPFDFAGEYAKAKWMEFDGQRVPFVGLDCLLEMKKDAARPKDLADIECLKKAQDETSA